jgi:hypothetical protein
MTKTQRNSSDGLQGNEWTVVSAILAMVVIPAVVTLSRFRNQSGNSDPTPLGYTWSLLFFIIPITMIGYWFLSNKSTGTSKRAFWRTIAILAPCGFGLDFFFASRFFTFPYPGATLQIPAPALGESVPIEEYVFYLTGFIAVLLIYVWFDEFWLATYELPEYVGRAKRVPRLFCFHVNSVVLGTALIGAAILYKKMFSSTPQGWPEYFVVLVAVAFVPAAGFFPTVRPFINWRALSLTLFIILFVSLLWEVTLAIPYGWWGYQPSQMMGLFIGAWHGLPIEAPLVWIAVTYATVIVYETVQLWQSSGKKARHAFFGEGKFLRNKYKSDSV